MIILFTSCPHRDVELVVGCILGLQLKEAGLGDAH